MLRSRQSWGAAEIRDRHSWPQSRFSGQRVQFCSLNREVKAACRASSSTPTTRPFSGQVSAPAPRSRRYDRKMCTAAPAAQLNTRNTPAVSMGLTFGEAVQQTDQIRVIESKRAAATPVYPDAHFAPAPGTAIGPKPATQVFAPASKGL